MVLTILREEGKMPVSKDRLMMFVSITEILFETQLKIWVGMLKSPVLLEWLRECIVLSISSGVTALRKKEFGEEGSLTYSSKLPKLGIFLCSLSAIELKKSLNELAISASSVTILSVTFREY